MLEILLRGSLLTNLTSVVFQVTGFQSFQSFSELIFRKIFVFNFKFSVRCVYNRTELLIKVIINSIRQLFVINSRLSFPISCVGNSALKNDSAVAH